ncbi:MAG: undecaprenyl/decaprenyl-phosphate alpha-N-acetylglucosaminyl 1-phosphate transferase [Clostridia bacterium]|nr:undecaprenyl/decaprenyl-phosphate alpha-N-acetylglucosaminyl 1-phosphate transferase [Clostridia bacterium]
MIWYIGAFGAALSFALTPVAMSLGCKLHAVDVPKDRRRMHQRRIPRSGGIALFFAFLISGLALCQHTSFLFCALGGGGLIFLLGLADDILCLGPRCKLFFQGSIGLATVLGCGVTAPRAVIGWLLWVLTLTNAHNFIDGLDGLLAGTVAVEATAMAAAFWSLGAGNLALPMLLLATVCLGFRCFNRHPAVIFAGDCGSGTLGFLLGVFSIPLGTLLPVGIEQLSLFFLFAYPLTDLLAAVLRRGLRGKSPFAADRGHLHHRIFDVGIPHALCVRLLHWICMGTAGIGVLLCRGDRWPFAGMLCFGVAILLIYLRYFIVGFVENG